MGIAPDVGALQFAPRAVGNQGHLNELLFTARKFDANEAKELGFVSKILPDLESAKKAAIEIAALIATKSPIAVQGAIDLFIIKYNSLVKQKSYNFSQLVVLLVNLY